MYNIFDMENEKLFLIYIPVPEQISEKIHQINEIINSKFDTNSYSSFYKGKWQSHIMLYLSPMDVERQEDIVKEVELLSKKLKKFRVVLGDFEKASGNYLFIGVKDDPDGYLRYVHDELVKILLSFRNSVIKEKYLQKWDSYTSEEQERIKNTGVPYEYVSHTSVASLDNEEEVKEAINILKEISLDGSYFDAEKIEIMTSDLDYSNKEIISSFYLE